MDSRSLLCQKKQQQKKYHLFYLGANLIRMIIPRVQVFVKDFAYQKIFNHESHLLNASAYWSFIPGLRIHQQQTGITLKSWRLVWSLWEAFPTPASSREKAATPEALRSSGFSLVYVVSVDADAVAGPLHAPWAGWNPCLHNGDYCD